MTRATLKISGMTCGGCAHTLSKVLKAVNGVSDVVVSLPGEKATITFDERWASVDALTAAVRRAGYEARDERVTASSAQRCGWQ